MLNRLNIFVYKNPFLTATLTTAFSGFAIWGMSLLIDHNTTSETSEYRKNEEKIQIQDTQSNKGINIQIGGDSNDITIKQKRIDENKPYTELKLIDFSIKNNIADFKLKNSGNDSAFLTRIVLSLRNISPPIACSHSGSMSYDFEVVFPDKAYTEFRDLSVCMFVMSPEERSEYELKQQPLPIGEIDISQVVPPRGVDRFQIKFKFKETSSGCLPHLFEGICEIFYDGEKSLKTPKFKIQN